MNPTSNRSFLFLSIVVIALGVLTATAQADERGKCVVSATFAKKATKKAPAPEPKKVEKIGRTVTAGTLPARKELLLAEVTIPVSVKVGAKTDDHFVIMAEAGEETRTEIRTAGLVEAHVVPGSLHYHD